MLLLLLVDKEKVVHAVNFQPHRTQPFVSKSVDIKWSLIPPSRLLKLVMKRLFKISLFFLSLSYVTLISFLNPYLQGFLQALKSYSEKSFLKHL